MFSLNTNVWEFLITTHYHEYVNAYPPMYIIHNRWAIKHTKKHENCA